MQIPSILIKLLSVVFLLSILYGTCSYYNENYETNRDYYTLKTILSDYPEGQMVSVSGVVTEVYDNGFYFNDYYQNIVYKVNSDSKVDINDEVFVLGKLGPSYELYDANVFIYHKWKAGFVLLRSIIGGFFLLILFLAYWKFDFKSFEFTRRK